MDESTNNMVMPVTPMGGYGNNGGFGSGFGGDWGWIILLLLVYGGGWGMGGFGGGYGAMMGMDNVEGLKRLSFLHYERLKYQRDEPRSSVRIANGHIERLIFTETDDGIEIELIEIDSTHYGNR